MFRLLPLVCHFSSQDQKATQPVHLPSSCFVSWSGQLLQRRLLILVHNCVPLEVKETTQKTYYWALTFYSWFLEDRTCFWILILFVYWIIKESRIKNCICIWICSSLFLSSHKITLLTSFILQTALENSFGVEGKVWVHSFEDMPWDLEEWSLSCVQMKCIQFYNPQ